MTTDLKRVMVYMPPEQHQLLRRLAFEKQVTMSDLMRQAFAAVYGSGDEDLGDIKRGKRRAA